MDACGIRLSWSWYALSFCLRDQTAWTALTPSALIFQRLSRDSPHTYKMNVSILPHCRCFFKSKMTGAAGRGAVWAAFSCLGSVGVDIFKRKTLKLWLKVSASFSIFKPEIGLEPTTPSLRVKCSTDWAIPANCFSSHKYYISIWRNLQAFLFIQAYFLFPGSLIWTSSWR